jgi:centromere kinetochore component U (CENP-U)
VSFGFSFAGTPAATKRSVSPPKKTPVHRTAHSSSQSAKGTSSLPSSGSVGSRKRKRSSELENGPIGDELADAIEVLSSASASKRRSLGSVRSDAKDENNFAPADDIEDNTDSKDFSAKRQRISGQFARPDPRTPLTTINNSLSTAGPSERSRTSNPRSSRNPSIRRQTKSPLVTIHEDDADQDELSLETIDDATNGELVAEDQQPTVTRRSDTTFVPELEGTRDELTNKLRRRSTVQPSVIRRSLKKRRPARGSGTTTKATKPKKPMANQNSADRTPGEPIQTVAITVYRRSKKPSVDTDPLGAMSIPAVNAADVLAQILTEMGNKYISRIADQTSKKEFESVLRYPLVSFMSNVQDLLFDLSTTQNSVFALTARLRSLKREQSELRAELIRTKRDREDVKLEIDSVRSNHLSQVKEEKDEHDLLNILNDLDVAIQRGRDRTREILEEDLDVNDDDLLLHDVQQLLDGGGLLGNIQEWNSLLEEASGAL